MAGDNDKQIENSDLAAIVATEIRNSQGYDQSQLSQKRSLTLEYLRGIMPDIPPRPNGSSQTSRDINDTMSWMLPGIVRVFTATNKMVSYEQVKDEPPEWAEQATSYMNYSFFVENDGYRILRNATYDSLAMGNGVACSYWDDEQSKTQTLRAQTPIDLASLLEDENVSILTQEATGETKDVDTGDDALGSVSLPTYDVKIKRVISKGKLCDRTCKPENLFLNTWATTIEDARFVGYLHNDKTRSDLVEMGFDKELVENLNTGANDQRNQVQLARTYDLVQTYASPVRSGDRIDLYECYLRADVDGDGIAELLQVWYAGDVGGGRVLEWEIWEDDIPYTDIPCYPIPHRWDAESVSDRTIDIQRVKTALLRAALDSTYASVLPQREVELGSVLNPDILTNPRFGGIIWKKQGTNGNAPIIESKIPYTADKSFAAMEVMDALITKRTGVSKTMMALDPDALQNQTATASQNMRDASYSQIELVARDMAEYGWAKFFRKRLKLAIKYHEIAQIPADNVQPQPDPNNPGQNRPAPKFQSVEPGNWDENMAVNINVGLGTGSRDRDMAMLNNMLIGQRQMAQELGAVDPAKAIEFIPKIRNTAVKIAESAGLKNPEDYYPEITDQEVQQLKQKVSQPPAPDPRIAADMQLAQLKLQGEQQAQGAATQIAQIKGQAETVKAQLEAQIGQLKLQMIQQQTQDHDQYAALKLQYDQLLQASKNDTDLKKQALTSLTQIEVARIGAKGDVDSQIVSAYLESLIGIQEHGHNMELQNAQQQNQGLDSNTTAKVVPQSNGNGADIAGMIKDMHAALTAPKRIVRDQNGRATGVETVPPGETVQ